MKSVAVQLAIAFGTTLLASLLVAWIFSKHQTKSQGQPIPGHELELGPFRYAITTVVRRRIRRRLWKRHGDELTEYLVRLRIVNRTNTASRPRHLEATVMAADDRRFPMTRATGPAFENDIFPGASAEGALLFVTPSGLVLTALYLRDPVSGFGDSMAMPAA
jgi:hypothetical protein